MWYSVFKYIIHFSHVCGIQYLNTANVLSAQLWKVPVALLAGRISKEITVGIEHELTYCAKRNIVNVCIGCLIMKSIYTYVQKEAQNQRKL